MDTFMYIIFFGLPMVMFVYLALDQLLWVWDTDLDTQIKRFIKWIY
jgi:hypothetical protein